MEKKNSIGPEVFEVIDSFVHKNNMSMKGFAYGVVDTFSTEDTDDDKKVESLVKQISAWKKGANPSLKTLKPILDYFRERGDDGEKCQLDELFRKREKQGMEANEGGRER